ncbi:MAG: phosphoribosylformylglycinamidine synthase subunit PurS [Clostridia bacterium]
MKYIAKIHVTLKEGVLDPQGVAVAGSLHSLGYDEVKEVRVGKFTTVTLEASSETHASKRVNEMCQKLLANPVIEEFSFEIEEVA